VENVAFHIYIQFVLFVHFADYCYYLILIDFRETNWRTFGEPTSGYSRVIRRNFIRLPIGSAQKGGDWVKEMWKVRQNVKERLFA
jgi:hypothetical protein